MSARYVWLRRSAMSVLVLLAVIVFGLGWLLGTSAGARFIVGQVVNRIPGSLTIGQLEGTFLSSLAVSDIRWNDGQFDASVDSTAIAVSPSILWNFNRLEIELLTIKGLSIRSPASPVDERAARLPNDVVIGELPSISMPIEILVQSMSVQNAAWHDVDGQPMMPALSSLTLAARWAATSLEVSTLKVRNDLGEVSLEGEVVTADVYRLSMQGVGQRTDDTAAVRWSVTGDRNAYAIDANLEMPAVAENGIQVKGQIALRDGQPLALDITAASERLLVPGVRVSPSDVVSTLIGTLSAWRLDVDAMVDNQPFGDGEISLVALAANNTIDLQQIRLSLASGGVLEFVGQLTIDDALRSDGALTLRDLPFSLLVPDKAGTLSGDVPLSVSYGEELTLSARQLRVEGDLDGESVELIGRMAYENQVLDVDALRMRIGANVLNVDGQLDVGGSSSMTVDIEATELVSLGIGVSGDLSGRVSVAGVLDSPVIDADISSDRFSGFGYAFSGTDLSVIWRGQQGEGRIRSRQFVHPAFSVDNVQVDATGGSQSHALRVAGLLDSHFSFFVNADGGLDGSRWKGTIASLSFSERTKDERILSAELAEPMQLSIGDGRLEASPFCLLGKPAISLCGSISVVGQQIASEGDLSIGDLRGISSRWLPEWALDGDLTAEWAVEGSTDRPAGQMTIKSDQIGLRRVGTEVEDKLLIISPFAGELTLDQQVLNADVSMIVPSAGRLSATLTVSDIARADSGVDGQVELLISDPSVLTNVLSSARVSGGSGQANIRVSGQLDEPSFRGNGQFSGIDVAIIPLGTTLSNTRLAINADSKNAVTLNASADSDQGSVSLDGRLNLSDSARYELSARLDAVNAALIRLPDIMAVASAGLDLVASPSGYRLSGNIDVEQAEITIRELPTGAARVSPDSRVFDANGNEIVNEVSPALKGELAIKASLSEAVTLSGFGLKTNVTGDIDIRQRAGRGPTGNGLLTLRDATYEAYGQALTVSRGLLRFSGPLDAPTLDIRAERTIEEQRVGIDVTGSPARLSSTLFSEPILPDAEAFSLLLTGRNLATLGSGEGGDLSGAAIGLGLRQAFSVTDGVRDALGLDTLTYAGSGRDGRLLAGKSLSSRLYLQYAYGVFDQISRVLLRLKINDRLSLESASGDAQSVDLIYAVGGGR